MKRDGSPVHGRLVLVATPIGNLGDLSPRAVRTLEASDIVCCEDTRRTRELLTHAGVLHKRLLSLNEHNEGARIPGVLARVRIGELVAVVAMPALRGCLTQERASSRRQWQKASRWKRSLVRTQPSPL